MAKKENREGIALRKNKKNSDGKLEIKKFCPKCNKTTDHKERKAA